VARGFIAGFITATFLYGAIFVAYRAGALDPWLSEGEGDEPANLTERDAGSDGAVETPRRGKRRARRRWQQRRARREARKRTSDQVVESGDSLESGPREVDMNGAGGEARLSAAQIDAAFSPAMARIRRCLLLLPEDASGRGRVVFGMRVAGSGQVAAVRLRGPGSLTTGEVGGCLQRTARAIRFPSFDGAETTFSYPITFE
jgi:hypothetical protein